ncbi:MAG: hypothetical protein GY859_43625, partial [Desulfobacterales bacterium]|nr:hypothetical protein [Desulfobacterales bacterium]
QLSISNIYYHQGKSDQVVMTGLSTTHEVSLVDTSYFGEVTGITPESSLGDQDIVITGRAVERSTGEPMVGVPLNLVITVKGFERKTAVFTDVYGVFAHIFTPLSGESGVYSVRAMHPDRLDRPIHGNFIIDRVKIKPTAINLSIPRNYPKTVTIRAAAGGGTTASNLRIVFAAEDQPDGVLPEGVHLTPGSPVASLAPGKSANLTFSIWADNFAENGAIVLKVKSDETAPDAWGAIHINAAFSEARPSLNFTPN